MAQDSAATAMRRASAHETSRRAALPLRRRFGSLANLMRSAEGDRSGGAGSRRPNFTGVWRQVTHENADRYFQAMGYPFATRRLMVHFIGQSTEVVSHDGERVHANSINLRGEWPRTYVENKKNVPMTLADGQAVKTTTWWERDEDLGVDVHKTRVVGAKQGVLETWRWIQGDVGLGGAGAEVGGENRKASRISPPQVRGRMTVKSIVYPEGREEEAESMMWHFEADEKRRGSLLKEFQETYVNGLEGGMGAIGGKENLGGAETRASTKEPDLAGVCRNWLDRFSKSVDKSFLVSERFRMEQSLWN